MFRLVLAQVKADGALPAAPGQLIVQGEDLAVWIAAQRAGWERLMPAQQWLLETVGIEPAAEGEPAAGAPRSQDARWTANLVAARQFHAREGHLQAPRKTVEIVDGAEHELGGLARQRPQEGRQAQPAAPRRPRPARHALAAGSGRT
ncbi:MAG: hypothetical protein JF597_32980 [Streptomyces sp.]|uniref:hypothetical protein n=1 Tax=Streptomyces sp. TaxID=1931 RepID=UPI0025CDFE26|nr:hypothetical protein [Streptomyces sp.]MBW8798226.1 hypothetical protein [Streptomyces sp.]